MAVNNGPIFAAIHVASCKHSRGVGVPPAPLRFMAANGDDVSAGMCPTACTRARYGTRVRPAVVRLCTTPGPRCLPHGHCPPPDPCTPWARASLPSATLRPRVLLPAPRLRTRGLIVAKGSTRRRPCVTSPQPVTHSSCTEAWYVQAVVGRGSVRPAPHPARLFLRLARLT